MAMDPEFMDDDFADEDDNNGGGPAGLRNNAFNYPSAWEVSLGTWFNPSDQSTAQIFNKIASFLRVKELKNVRLVSRNCYLNVTRSPKFVRNVVLKLPTASFYQDLRVRNVDMSLAGWKTVHLRHFNFYKRRTDFQNCWKQAMGAVTELSISSGAMECDGFSFLLNQCESLETLRLYDNLRLRDSTVVHTGQRNYPRVQARYDPFGRPPGVIATAEQTLGMRTAFKNLDITGLNWVDDCFMAHLADRSGWLESLTIGHMFHDLRGIHAPGCECCPAIGDVKAAFEARLLHLIGFNGSTLRSLTVDCNANQDRFISKLGLPATFPQALRLRRLVFKLNAQDEPLLYRGFMDKVAPTLEAFELGFKGEFNNEGLAHFLIPGMVNLMEFKLTFDGAENRRNRVSLQALGIHAPNLRRVEIVDTKDTKRLFLRIARGLTGRRRQRQDAHGRPAEQERIRMRNEVSSSVGLNFLETLPISLTELRFTGLVIPDAPNDISNVSILQRFQHFRNMTKLEIRGPLLEPAITGVRLITREMMRLQELTLSNVGLTDSEVTGLTNPTCQTLRRSQIYGAFRRERLRPLLAELIPLRRPVRPAPPNEPNPWPEGEDVFSYSHLRDLRKLDISGNYGVSDVTLFFGMFELSPRLTHLNISSCKLVTNLGLEMVAFRFPNIEDLDIRYMYRVSYLTMDRVIRQCPRLKRIVTSVSQRMHQAVTSGLVPAFCSNFESIVQVVSSPADSRLELAELLRDEAEDRRRGDGDSDSSDTGSGGSDDDEEEENDGEERGNDDDEGGADDAQEEAAADAEDEEEDDDDDDDDDDEGPGMQQAE